MQNTWKESVRSAYDEIFFMKIRLPNPSINSSIYVVNQLYSRGEWWVNNIRASIPLFIVGVLQEAILLFQLDG